MIRKNCKRSIEPKNWFFQIKKEALIILNDATLLNTFDTKEEYVAWICKLRESI